ncbi:hypothetical protein ADU59_23985 [Pararhizobium polonicum]|uniref:Uncharacterized protein n=1 Tax=Pararhizobium polonicum TaxID=1612624 RepID=A0A1C7P0A0_9HYPH|nr:hypothetical protein [Pararhizobium polonicum]OBZ93134.1 hypothetical protein ADU59_23985 [Pararhizobium polonicum]
MPSICGPEKLPLDPALFEILCRAAVGRMGIPSFCRHRRCGREEECVGKLKPREIPPCFRGLQDVDAMLPMCIAQADDTWFREFVLQWILCREDYFDRVRPPETVRSLLALDEQWPVSIYVEEEEEAPATGRRFNEGWNLIDAPRASLEERPVRSDDGNASAKGG